MRRFALTLLAGTAIGVTGTAYAADLYAEPIVEAPVVYNEPATWSWTGIHGGVGVGGVFNFADVYSGWKGETDWDGDFLHDLSSQDLGAADFLVTGEIGASWHIPGSSIVVGIAGNYDWNATKNGANDSSCFVNSNAFCPEPFSGDSLGGGEDYSFVQHDVEWGDNWAVTGRVGVLVTPRTLVYGLGGYQQTEVTGQFTADYDNDIFSLPGGDPEDGGVFKTSKWTDGFVVGAGMEVFLTKRISLKGEYRYAKLSGTSLECEFSDCHEFFTPAPGEGGDVDIDGAILEVGDTHQHSVRASLNFWLN
jgi:opacity protein-like surface antigen